MTITYKDKAPVDYKRANFEVAKEESTNLRKLVLAVRKAIIDAKKSRSDSSDRGSSISRAKSGDKLKVAVVLNELPKIGLSDFDLGEILVREALLADYEFTKYLSKPAEGWKFITELAFIGKPTTAFKKGVGRGKLVAGEVNMTRELSNTPAGEMSPAMLAAAARAAVEGTAVTVQVLDVVDMKKLGMGALLAVGQGSDKEPRFVVMEYRGGDVAERPIVLVGKGITFDSGGLQLKPAKGGSLHEMHLDMSGGAAVIYTLTLAAKLGIKKNIIGLIPAAENMISGTSYHPGDILRSMSGKTIEIGNTDAEGRLILADALTYAERYNPRLVVDVATLTGGALVALGVQGSGIFTDDNDLAKTTEELAERAFDRVWRLPLWDEFLSELKSSFADINNAGKNSPHGAASVGAIFLKQFVDKYPKDCKWMHIDMAPTMTATDDEFLAKGAKGTPVKLLLSLIENY